MNPEKKRARLIEARLERMSLEEIEAELDRIHGPGYAVRQARIMDVLGAMSVERLIALREDPGELPLDMVDFELATRALVDRELRPRIGEILGVEP